MPKVSIVLPSYNGERYIGESIESVIVQTFKDWELIIVDDCSQDQTFSVAQEYAAKDTRIRVIHNEENQKLPKALNIGFKLARGEYLTWTSDDNAYKTDAIGELVKYLDEHPCDCMVCADSDVIDEKGQFIRECKPKIDELLVYNSVGACFLYRKGVIPNIGQYDGSRFLVEDYDYWLRIMQYYGAIGYLKENLYRYRMHDGSLSATKKADVRKQVIKLRFDNLGWLLKRIAKRNDLLWKMYYEFYSVKDIGINLEKIKEAFSSYLPIGEIVNSIVSPKDKFIIYGAGYWGSKCRDILGKKVACFVDSDRAKEGMYLGGIPVFHSSKLYAVIGDSKIMIAVAPEIVYEVFCGISLKYRNRVTVCHEIIGQELFVQSHNIT